MSWESWDIVLSDMRNVLRIHGTWWQLDKLDMGSEDNVSVTDGPEGLNLKVLNVSLLLWGYTWASWPWNMRSCDICRLTPILNSFTTTTPLIYCTIEALVSQFPEYTRLLPNSEPTNAIYVINAICFTSTTIIWLIHILSRLPFMCCFLRENFLASTPRPG